MDLCGRIALAAATLAVAAGAPAAWAQVPAAPKELTTDALVEKHGCLLCHTVETKVLGPGYKEVARKYKDDPKAAELLAQRIKKGSKGVWGNVEMPANDISDADALRLAKWVLSL
jgi:cytochrome c